MNLIKKLLKLEKGATLILDKNGRHEIGGKAPDELTIPVLDTSPVVYFGKIMHEEKCLKWVDFDFYLLCPIFLNIGIPVFMDYSNSLSPLIIRDNVPTLFQHYFDEIPASAHITYTGCKFRFDPGYDRDLIRMDAIGSAGEPDWLQGPDWPISPISGKRMKFLFQLADVNCSEAITGKEYLEKESLDTYLHFAHGDLYVFFEPETRIVAYLNQFT